MPTKQSGKITFQMLTLWFFHNKPCMLINMADELQNTSQFFCHFTVPSNPLDAQVPCPGPYLFYSIDMQNQFPHYRQPAVLPYQVPMPHASPLMSSLPSSKSESTKNEESPQPGARKRNHGSNWTDVETRYLLELWRDNFPISKERNSTEWDAITKKLNSTFKDQGIPCYCTGTQCKVCIKYLRDQYKWVKDHNSQSGNNWEWFEYYDEIYEVLGSKPNITPKDVKCGLAEDANTTTVGDSDTLPEWNIPADYKRNADLEQELKRKLKKNLKWTQNVPKKGAKEKRLL